MTVIISGLLALKSYQSYCYVQLSDGSGSEYVDVISMPRLFNTTCCRTVSFSNAPISVYGDVSQYISSGNSGLSAYVFSYYLESAPTHGAIVVTPTITLEDGSTSNYSVITVPSSAEFMSTYTSSRLKGQFYISAASTVSGGFRISLEVSGQDKMTFSTATTLVNILSISQPLPAPALESCKFDESGGYLVVNFDKSTDQGGITADTWPCSQLLEFAGSNQTICSWTSLSTIKVVFTSLSASSLKPSDTMSVRGGILRAACRGNIGCKNNFLLKSYQTDHALTGRDSMKYAALTSTLSVIVQRPAHPVAPLIIVLTPTQVGACNDLLIDLSASSGSGGRPWSSVVWSVLAQNGNTTALRNFLRDNFDSSLNYVIVPRHMLIRTTYSIGVTITNFLGDSASSASIVAVTDDSNLPVVSILGSVARTIKASDVLTLRGSAISSSCGFTYSLKYTWTLTNSSGVLITSKSTSTDPRVYVALSHSFVTGSSYVITLTVASLNLKGQQLSSGYTSANIYVAHGNVKAAVRGGYARESSLDKVLSLDASISSDEDSSAGSADLLFSWGCTIASLADFGSDCNFGSVNIATLSTSTISLPAYAMILSSRYLFSVTVSSADGRSASQNVLITPLSPGASIVFSDNKLSKFNQDSLVFITGSVNANVSTIAMWTAYSNGLSVSLDRAYTKLTKEFTAKEASVTASYPLAVLPDTFVGGRTYTFRLSSYPLGNTALTATTEVVMTANSPPIGGRTSVSPIAGSALATDFSMSTSGWSDDLSDYPLSYSFSYQLAISDLIPALTIAVLSPLPYAVSVLPPGLDGGTFFIAMHIHRCNEYHFYSECLHKFQIFTFSSFLITGLGNAGDVTIIGLAQDIYRAAGQALFIVNVVLEKGFNTSSFLESTLTSNIATGNVDGVLQTVNVVSSVVSMTNCSAAPNCTALNRNGCLQTVNTCSSCLHNYQGISGDSNTRCVQESSTIGTIGSTCKHDADCLYHHCDNGICKAPQRSCQSGEPGTVCSGHGTCIYSDSSGNTVQNCTIIDQHCSALCSCRGGYGGADCSLDTASLAGRSNVRVDLCKALMHVISVSEKSPQLFDSIASTLLSAYDKDEITGSAQLVKCSSVVRFLGTLASRGFMKGTLPATQQIFAEISSQFVGTRVSANSSHAAAFANDVSNAVTGITQGVLKGMVEGQSPVSLTTSYIRATMINELVSSLSNVAFSPPLTAAELMNEPGQSKIVIAGNSLSSCSWGSPYAQISTLQFGSNPHVDSKSIRSPLLQFSSVATAKLSKAAKSKSRALLSSINSNSKSDVGIAYYVILQFLSKQNFNLSVLAGLPSSGSNVSLPICTIYDKNLAKYVSCGNCDISSYTNFNVTFGCYDIKHLCPSAIATKRQLGSFYQQYDGQKEIIAEDGANEIREDDGDMLPTFGNDLRELVDGASDDYKPSADDGPADSDDQFNTERTAQVSEFGLLLGAIANELSNVLSVNPFSIDYKKATPVLALVGCLCGSVILGLLYFLRRDMMERHKTVYLLDEKERKIKNQIAEDFLRGGNGVTSMRPKSSLKKSQHNDSFINVFNTSLDTLLTGNTTVNEDSHRRFSEYNLRTSMSSKDGLEDVDHDELTGLWAPNIRIAQFSNEVLPRTYTLKDGALKLKRDKFKINKSTWTDAVYTIRHKHYITAMLYRPSLYVSRTLRFVDMCRKVLLYLFIDTLIYGVFFPSDATCGTLTRKAACTAVPSKVSS